MLRAPCFSLLSVSQCVEFANNLDEVLKIKEGIQRYLRSDAYELLEHIGAPISLVGWKHIIFDLVFNNELTDIRAINMPDLTAYNIDA